MVVFGTFPRSLSTSLSSAMKSSRRGWYSSALYILTPRQQQELSCDGLKWLEPLSARPMLSCGRMTWKRVDGGRHKSKILWLSHRRVGPRRCPGSRWSPAPGTRAPVEHGCAPDWCWCRWPWERRSRGPRAAPAGNWGSPAWGWWSRPPPRAPSRRWLG